MRWAIYPPCPLSFSPLMLRKIAPNKMSDVLLTDSPVGFILIFTFWAQSHVGGVGKRIPDNHSRGIASGTQQRNEVRFGGIVDMGVSRDAPAFVR